jgi:hypothetical protein
LHLFRRFWSAILKPADDLEPGSPDYQTDADRLNAANEQIAYYNLNHVSEGAYGDIARNFHKWWKENKRQQTSNAGKISWTPANRKKRKKSLGRRKKRRK